MSQPSVSGGSAPGTIQEIAHKLAEAKLAEHQQRDDLHTETTLFVLGSESVGKTTILNRFLDKESTTTTTLRPTLALEYSFIRRHIATTATPAAVSASSAAASHQPQQRPVCHIWELGGEIASANNLCDIPVRSARHGLRQLRCVLALDLAQPECLWRDLTQTLGRLEAAMRKVSSSSSVSAPQEYERVRARRWQQQLHAQHQQKDAVVNSGAQQQQTAVGGGDGDDLLMSSLGGDSSSLSSLALASNAPPMPAQYFPIPLVILGCKYDVFQNFDPEIKKHVCRALRSVALLLGATGLQFVSTHSAAQMAALREQLNELAFRSVAALSRTAASRRRTGQRPVVVDHNEALNVPVGADSWTLIGHMPKQAVAEVGVMLAAHIPQRAATKTDDANESDGGDGDLDPATDPNFREPAIDERRAQLDAESAERWRDAEVRQQFQSMSSAASLAEMSSDF